MPPQGRIWLLAVTLLLLTFSLGEASHRHVAILDIDELLNVPMRDQEEEPVVVPINNLRGGQERAFQLEEIQIELQENEDAITIERKPVVEEVAQEPLVADDDDTDTDATEELNLESFLKEEADIENDTVVNTKPQLQRRRTIRTSQMENLNQKTHKTAIGSFYHNEENVNTTPTETTGKHTNKIAQQMYYEEELIDRMFVTQMSVVRTIC